MNLKAKEGLSVSDMIVVGFALFSMFFGAGNTVFPPVHRHGIRYQLVYRFSHVLHR